MNSVQAVKFLSNLARSAKEITMPLWLKFRGPARHEPLSGLDGGVTVSLTAIPSRIDRLWVVLDSLMRQDRRPDRIVVSLTEEEFPGGVDSLPQSMRSFADLGVEILFLPYNLKCHNKYFHALQHYPESCVITVDDDCWYTRDTISRLMRMHEAYPDAVVSNIARRIDREQFFTYRMWEKMPVPSAPSHLNVALGFGAILYPPHFADRCREAGYDVFDMDLIKSLAPTTDDLWLKAIEMVSGVQVACGSFYPNPVTVTGSQKISLRSVNKGTENRNDLQWKALDDHFKLRQII